MLVVDYLGHIPMCCYSFQKVIPWRGNHHHQPNTSNKTTHERFATFSPRANPWEAVGVFG